jgi:hypothetical protein
MDKIPKLQSCDTAVAQFLRVLEGQLFVEIDGASAILSTEDTAVKYWSKVALTRFYTAAAVVPGAEAAVKSQRFLGLVGQLISQAEVWDSAVFLAIEA